MQTFLFLFSMGTLKSFDTVDKIIGNQHMEKGICKTKEDIIQRFWGYQLLNLLIICFIFDTVSSQPSSPSPSLQNSFAD